MAANQSCIAYHVHGTFLMQAKQHNDKTRQMGYDSNIRDTAGTIRYVRDLLMEYHYLSEFWYSPLQSTDIVRVTVPHVTAGVSEISISREFPQLSLAV
jgi:hypothetical protein